MRGGQFPDGGEGGKNPLGARGIKGQRYPNEKGLKKKYCLGCKKEGEEQRAQALRKNLNAGQGNRCEAPLAWMVRGGGGGRVNL